MLAFGAGAALLVLIAVAFLLLPLLRKGDSGVTVDRGDSNLQVLRNHQAELDADLRSGILSADQYESACTDLERRVLEESQKSAGTSGAPRIRRWGTPVLIGICLPVFAVLLYLYVGNVDGLDVEAYMQEEAAGLTPERVEMMTRQLAQRLKDEPNDVEGWAMLGRSYMALQQFPDSAQAWGQAAALEPDNASILANYAEALGLAAQGNLDGEPSRLLARALVLDPSHPKALALSGGAAFGRGDYPEAIAFWQRLLQFSGDDEELSNALRAGISQAQSRLDGGTKNAPGTVENAGGAGNNAAAPGAIRGVVSLSPQMTESAGSGDTVFIFVRPADGPRMPLAVARVKVEELPYDFQLDDSMAMIPDRKISDFRKLVVGARVSSSGNAMRASGDIEGFSSPVGPITRDVQVLIDKRVP